MEGAGGVNHSQVPIHTDTEGAEAEEEERSRVKSGRDIQSSVSERREGPAHLVRNKMLQYMLTK